MNEPMGTPAPQMPDMTPVEPPKDNKNMIIWIVVAVVLCCCCVIAAGAGYYVWNNY